jgi:hypothetical protein
MREAVLAPLAVKAARSEIDRVAKALNLPATEFRNEELTIRALHWPHTMLRERFQISPLIKTNSLSHQVFTISPLIKSKKTRRSAIQSRH